MKIGRNLLLAIVILLSSFMGTGFQPLPVSAQERDEGAEISETLASIYAEYEQILNGQTSLPTLDKSKSEAQLHPLSLPASGCFVIAKLDEEGTVPTGSSNLMAVTNDSAGAENGKVYYRQTNPGNAQVAISPFAHPASGSLFYSFAVKNESGLVENVTKVETLNNSTQQGGVNLHTVPPYSGWTTFVGSLIAGAKDNWILTLATSQYALPLSGALKFDNIKVISCDTKVAMLPMIAGYVLKCPSGQEGVAMTPLQTVEDIANAQFVPPGNISVSNVGATRLACWDRNQQQAYRDGETLDFFGSSSSVFESTFVGALSLPSINSAKPFWMNKIIASSATANESAFGTSFLAELTGPMAILGYVAGYGYSSYRGYLREASPTFVYQPTSFIGMSGDILTAHVPNVNSAALEGSVNVYRMGNFPKSDEAMKQVLAYTCIVHCPYANRDGWVITKASVTGASLLTQSTYEAYLAAVDILVNRYRKSEEEMKLSVIEASRERTIELLDPLVKNVRNPNLIDILPPLPPIGDGDEDMSNKCFVGVEHYPDDSGKYKDITKTIELDLGYKVATGDDKALNLLRAISKGALTFEMTDISYQFQGPPWPIGSEALIANPYLNITVVYKCMPPKNLYLPFALFWFQEIRVGTLYHPWRPYAAAESVSQ